MLTENPVKIPDIPGRITILKNEDKEYVRFLLRREYDAERKFNKPEWITIGRKCEQMPGMMYPNDNYEKYLLNGGEEAVDGEMTKEEAEFAGKNRTYSMYSPFFEALYHEFRQQSRKHPDQPVNPYKAKSLNHILLPLKDMMQGEEYAEMLELIPMEGEESMSYSDAMILMTQYKCALAKFHRDWR